MAQDSLNRRGRLRAVERPRLMLRDPADELPANPDYDGVGASLRSARRQAGLTIDDVAGRLRIRRDYLRAMERGDFGALPGTSYAQGFLRSYADYLHLDGARAVELFKEEAGGAKAGGQLSFPVPAAEQRLPRLWLVLAALVLAGVIYGVWANHQESLFAVNERVPPVPERILAAAPPAPAVPATPILPVPPVEPSGLPTSVPPAQATPPVAEAPPVEASSGTPRADLAAPASPPSPAGPAFPAIPPVSAPSEAPPPLPQPQAAVPAEVAPLARPPGLFGSEQPDVRVVIRATQRAWIRVAGPQGQTLFQRILEPGETYRVPNQPDLVMDAGNLGGIDVAVDGKVLPPLGGPGVPKRNIALAPAALQAQATPLERRPPAN